MIDFIEELKTKYTKPLRHYTNGNYIVDIWPDGTKVRWDPNGEPESNTNKYQPKYPESIDMKITNKCYYNCDFCHEKSSSIGIHANTIKMSNFIKSIPYGCEVALGGGSVLEHPEFENILALLKSQGVICNATINGRDLINNEANKNYKTLMRLVAENQIMGIGVSYMGNDTMSLINDFISNIKTEYKIDIKGRVVVHIIAGLIHVQEVEDLLRNEFKVLLLGYKDWGRGKDVYKEKKDEIEDQISLLSKALPKLFKIPEALISFDNRAISQVNLQRIVTDKTWTENFMGEEGQFSMFVDLVSEQYTVNSTTCTRFNIENKTLEDCFKHIKEISEIIKGE